MHEHTVISLIAFLIVIAASYFLGAYNDNGEQNTVDHLSAAEHPDQTKLTEQEQQGL